MRSLAGLHMDHRWKEKSDSYGIIEVVMLTFFTKTQ